jgi:type VI secretion system secreted protein VgrG
MRGITKNGAERIFRDFFWDSQKADQIRSQAIANTIVDHQVNAGSGVKLAQQVLNDHFGFNMSEDNQIGPQTLSALNSVNATEFVNIYNRAREAYYRRVGNSTFLEGWLIRLEKFAVEGFKKKTGF